MRKVDDLILQIKRGETPAARGARDLYRRLLRWNVPDTALVRRVYGALYYAHDALVAGREYAASKLVYEPMARARFARVGQRLQLSALPYVQGHARIEIGDDCRIGRIAISTGRFCDDPELVIGNDCYIASDVFFSVNRSIRIGNGVGIAGRVAISDSDSHPSDPERRARGEEIDERDCLPVVLDDYAWVGRDAHILKGVTVGRGAVVASGSVVASDVPPGAMAMGVPARIIKRP